VDQLQYWMNYYPREQFLIIRSEDLYSKPAETVKETLQFLGVPEAAIETNKEYKRYKVPTRTGYKVKSGHPKMDPETRQYLIDYFRPHNARLREFLNRDFDWTNNTSPHSDKKMPAHLSRHESVASECIEG